MYVRPASHSSGSRATVSYQRPSQVCSVAGIIDCPEPPPRSLSERADDFCEASHKTAATLSAAEWQARRPLFGGVWNILALEFMQRVAGGALLRFLFRRSPSGRVVFALEHGCDFEAFGVIRTLFVQ